MPCVGLWFVIVAFPCHTHLPSNYMVCLNSTAQGNIFAHDTHRKRLTHMLLASLLTEPIIHGLNDQTCKEQYHNMVKGVRTVLYGWNKTTMDTTVYCTVVITKRDAIIL